MDKNPRCVCNWPKYNEALVQRGSISLWFSEEIIEKWNEPPKKQRLGRPYEYSDAVIQCALQIKCFFNLTFRQTQGFLQSLLDMLSLNFKAPHYTLLCKRFDKATKQLSKRYTKRSNAPCVLLIDSTGLKIFGEGEWKTRQHGVSKRRVWRKIHLGVNADTQELEAVHLTTLGTQDCEAVPDVFRKAQKPVTTIIGDGAYDRFSCYEHAHSNHYDLITPPQRNSRPSTQRPRNRKKASPEAVSARDQAIFLSKLMGRSQWKKMRGYHRRSLAETGVYRLKQMFRGKLTSRLFEKQKAEIQIWQYVFNRITKLGIPTQF